MILDLENKRDVQEGLTDIMLRKPLSAREHNSRSIIVMLFSGAVL